jgi:hypothetical protein
MEDLKITAAQVATSRTDGGTRIVFGSVENLKLGDYLVTEYEGERLKFKVCIVSTLQGIEHYAVTADFRGNSYVERSLDVKKLIGLQLVVADADSQANFKRSENLI